jgi:hypothetical protein
VGLKVAVLYDVHGNLPALEAVLAKLIKPKPPGLLVNYFT